MRTEINILSPIYLLDKPWVTRWATSSSRLLRASVKADSCPSIKDENVPGMVVIICVTREGGSQTCAHIGRRLQKIIPVHVPVSISTNTFV